METVKLKLPLISGNMNADVVRDMNALAEAIDEKVGANNGLASLGPDGKVPAEQLNLEDLKSSLTSDIDKINQTVATHLAEHLRIEIGVAPPENPNSKTFWLEDLGESIDFGLGGGSGLIIANASLDGSTEIWFKENE